MPKISYNLASDDAPATATLLSFTRVNLAKKQWSSVKVEVLFGWRGGIYGAVCGCSQHWWGQQ